MRILSCLIGIGLVLSFSSQAVARCAPDALGTARTIVLDPKKHRSLSGKEASLGLRHKEVILTFDDGPIAGKTSRILKSLKKECVKATFFYVGTMARAYPRLVRKVVNQGHTLAHHTHSHNRLPNYSSEKISRLIDKGVSRLQKIAYSDASSTPRTPFFRYPYLARSKRTDKVLAKKGMIAFGANIDSVDWKRSSPRKLHERIMRRLRKQGRGIILMHDIQARTAKMLPDLLSSLKSEGYKVVHIVSKTNKRPATKQVEVASLHKPVGRLTSTALPPRNAKKIKNIPLKYRKKRFYRSNLTAGSANQGRRSKRRAKPVLLAGVRTRGTIAMGNWKLRRSQWILR